MGQRTESENRALIMSIPKVILVSKYILPFGYGITLGNWLLVRKDSEDLAYVIQHERIHWAQWQKEGSYFKWLAKYIFANIKYGYANNPYETEAVTKASNNP
jgi:hypothetical protein